MNRFLLALILLFACGSVQAQVGSINVPRELPKGIKEWDEFAGCDRIPPCVIVYDNAQVQYDLYTQPGRAGIYTISHFRVRPTKATGAFATYAKGYREREVVIWFEFLGQEHVPHFNQHIFIKKGRRTWYTAGLFKRWRWVQYPRLSPEGNLESMVAQRLWRLRADVLETDTDTTTLTF